MMRNNQLQSEIVRFDYTCISVGLFNISCNNFMLGYYMYIKIITNTKFTYIVYLHGGQNRYQHKPTTGHLGRVSNQSLPTQIMYW